MISRIITIEGPIVTSHLTEHTSDHFYADVEEAARACHGLYSIDESDHIKIAGFLGSIVDGPDIYDYRCTSARYVQERSISRRDILTILSGEIKSCDVISSITGSNLHKIFEESMGVVTTHFHPFYIYTLFYLQDEDRNRLPEFANLLLSPESDVRCLAEILYKRLSIRL